MLLSYEDAYFYKLILQNGFYNEINDWIDNIATNNDVLEGIYLDLVCNQNNLNELISCIHSYIGNNKIDDKGLCDRLRLFIKEKIDKGEISYEEAANSLCGFAIKSEKWEEEPWKDFYMISVYGDYMDGGFLDVKDYHKIVIEFVNTGILLHPDDYWKARTSKQKNNK